MPDERRISINKKPQKEFLPSYNYPKNRCAHLMPTFEAAITDLYSRFLMHREKTREDLPLDLSIDPNFNNLPPEFVKTRASALKRKITVTRSILKRSGPRTVQEHFEEALIEALNAHYNNLIQTDPSLLVKKARRRR